MNGTIVIVEPIQTCKVKYQNGVLTPGSAEMLAMLKKHNTKQFRRRGCKRPKSVQEIAYEQLLEEQEFEEGEE